MMNRIESLLKDCHGATAVEFAFIAPIMLTLVFGIVAYGSIISVNNGLQQLAGEAAKASLAGLTDPDRTQLAKAFVAYSDEAGRVFQFQAGHHSNVKAATVPI